MPLKQTSLPHFMPISVVDCQKCRQSDYADLWRPLPHQWPNQGWSFQVQGMNDRGLPDVSEVHVHMARPNAIIYVRDRS